MTDKKLTELDELTNVADTDWAYIVDISDTTDSPDGTSKKYNPAKIKTQYFYVQDTNAGATVSTPPAAGDTPTVSYVLNDRAGQWLGDMSFYGDGTMTFGNWVVDGDVQIFGTYEYTGSVWNSDLLISYDASARQVQLCNQLYNFDATATVGAGQDNYVLKYDHSTQTIGLEAESGGGSQTPWTSNIDAAKYDLGSLGQLELEAPVSDLQVQFEITSSDWIEMNATGAAKPAAGVGAYLKDCSEWSTYNPVALSNPPVSTDNPAVYNAIYDQNDNELLYWGFWNSDSVAYVANAIRGADLNLVATNNAGNNLDMISINGQSNAITLNSGATIDGRDLGTDGTKLDGIASGAEVNPDVVSQAEAEAGTATTERIWTAQRVAQAIAALESGGGTTVTFFQVEDDNTTGQTTTATYADLAGIWATPSITDSDFSWNGTTGVLTVNTAGTLCLDILVMAYQATGANRTEMDIALLEDTGGGYSIIMESSNYSHRNTTQRKGGASIPGFKRSVSAGDDFKIQVRDVGTAVDVGSSSFGPSTYISAALYS